MNESCKILKNCVRVKSGELFYITTGSYSDKEYHLCKATVDLRESDFNRALAIMNNIIKVADNGDYYELLLLHILELSSKLTIVKVVLEVNDDHNEFVGIYDEDCNSYKQDRLNTSLQLATKYINLIKGDNYAV